VKMPVLDKKFLNGGGNISIDTVNKLLTASLDQGLARTLSNLGWQGQPIGIVGLTLAPDGVRIRVAEFGVRGQLSEEPFAVQASKLFDCSRDIEIEFSRVRGEAFKFSTGRMCSDYLEQEFCEYSVKQNDTVLNQEEGRQLGVGQFALRMVVHLDKASNGRAGPHFKVTVMAFPRSAEQLAETAGAQSASWPGIKILEAKCGFFPPAGQDTWGAPFFPILVSSERAAAIRSLPSGEMLRFAMAQLLRTALLPTACTARARLARKEQEMAEPEEVERQPTVQWPAVAEPQSILGK
jgi:hypothetical protein